MGGSAAGENGSKVAKGEWAGTDSDVLQVVHSTCRDARAILRGRECVRTLVMVRAKRADSPRVVVEEVDAHLLAAPHAPCNGAVAIVVVAVHLVVRACACACSCSDSHGLATQWHT